MTSKVLTAALMPSRVLLVVQAITLLARRLRQLPTVLAHRDQVRRLAGTDDHFLADIGVTRDDVDMALSAPFWRDPSAELMQRRDESKADGTCQRMSRTTRAAGQPAVSSPELILAACNRRLRIAPR